MTEITENPKEFAHLLDVTSGTWKFVRAWCLDRIVKLSLKNEEVGLDMEETNAIRGAIRDLRILLAQANPKMDVKSYAIPTTEKY